VAAFLLTLAHRMREGGWSGTSLELRMSRAEIGSYLGLTLESVSRAFSSFAAHRWIEVRQRHVRLLSLEQLERLCEGAGADVQARPHGAVVDRGCLAA
jgi:CRP/FNR family transcriptional regulator